MPPEEIQEVVWTIYLKYSIVPTSDEKYHNRFHNRVNSND